MNDTDGFIQSLSVLAVRPADLPPPFAALSLIWAFVIAACWGSFTNVVIARVPAGVSVVWPRSRCPRCSTSISAADNIPIVSWLLLRARCRACRAPISWRYPFVELLVGLLGVALVARHGWSLEALEAFTFAVILVAIAFVDIDTWTVPHPLWVALALGGVIFGVIHSLREDDWWVLGDRAIGAIAASASLAAIVVVATAVLRRTGRLGPGEFAMGWGDPLILLGVGAFLGWRLLPLVIFLASLQGAVVGAVLKARGRLRGERPVSETDDWVPPEGALPFGPFLALGALQAAFFSDALMPFISLGAWSAEVAG